MPEEYQIWDELMLCLPGVAHFGVVADGNGENTPPF
jgi:hypothetical protein